MQDKFVVNFVNAMDAKIVDFINQLYKKYFENQILKLLGHFQ